MNEKTKERIDPGDLVRVDGKVYLTATLIASKSCVEQCALAGGNRCGYCFRWDNTEEVVFRYLLPDTVVKADTVVYTTPDSIGRHLMEREKKNIKSRNQIYRSSHKREGEKKKTGRKPQGGIEHRTTRSYRATIIVDGVRYTYTATSEEEARRWLDDFKKERGLV